MKRTAALACTLLLIGCAGGNDWSRQGSSSKQTAAEYADCQSQARDATARDTNIMTDITASRASDWNRTGVMSTQMSLFAAENHDQTSSLVNRCMLSKGFVP
jgi:hypothetical protein